MKKITLKTLGLFMAVFAVAQMGHVEKSHATTQKTGGQSATPFETDSHGNACCCASCSKPLEIVPYEQPA